MRKNRVDLIDHAGYKKTPLSIDEYLEFRFEGETQKQLAETFRFPGNNEKIFKAYKKAGGTRFDYAKQKK